MILNISLYILNTHKKKDIVVKTTIRLKLTCFYDSKYL